MSDTATAAAVPSPAGPEADARTAYLLHLLAAAPGRKLTRCGLGKKLETKPAEAVGLPPGAAPGLIDRLASGGFVRVGKAGRAVVYELTDAGGARLEAVRALVPPARPVGSRGRVVPPPNDQVRDYRTGYLLLQVLRSPRH